MHNLLIFCRHGFIIPNRIINRKADTMNKTTESILNNINRAIIQFRGVYSEWSKKNNISYNEMLVLYTIREFGFCTQKQVCDSYLLPRQTINNVITRMRSESLIIPDPKHNIGREKAFVLTEEGKIYFENFMSDMNTVEEKAVQIMGEEKMRVMTELVCEYNSALKKSLTEYSGRKIK